MLTEKENSESYAKFGLQYNKQELWNPEGISREIHLKSY